ncbi:MAG: cytochrome b/b6 domain-containing protein [Gammaproteobacteria bacterium]|nr:cytochrome b/b6 domain-containing protein [Gammaproteobacteria bacterium]MDH5693413.1 cytochrome b/b6 domain-containing protein [Gammaproteobacteria bacterium]
MEKVNEVKVWDPAVRIFHWTLVASFLVAYLSEDDFMSLHVWAGYLIGGLIIFRLIWGLIGTRYARFSSFVKRPQEVRSYLRDVLLFRAKRYLGHNPAGGAMIIALLLSLTITTVTGVMVYGAEESAGPLAPLFAGASESVEDVLEEVHEFFANFTVFLVFFHVAGVVIASFQHHENLVRSMVTGLKARTGSDENNVIGS